jgi:DNA-binding MarR family transcriptional regulator
VQGSGVPPATSAVVVPSGERARSSSVAHYPPPRKRRECRAIISDCDVSFVDVNPMSLFLLGRKLMQIAEGALPKGKTAQSGRLVFVDVAYHPNSSISEITERTGFPQSLVSTAVARLREMGLLESGPDPFDRRRTLVRTTPVLQAIQGRLGLISIDDFLAKELAAEDRAELTDVIAAIDLLSRLLTPEVLSDEELSALLKQSS